ncbi:S8 family serine peptidase, partial [Escherichia coli]|nr:S8 family serine peptidase [Escherichia coli]
KYSWGIANGTSMATPVVTGTLALWLEACPELTLKEVKKIIEKTAYHDSNTGNTINAKYGMGKLDAIAGLYDILQMTSLQQETHPAFNYIYDRNSGEIEITSPDPVEKVHIYSISGNILSVINHPINNKFHIELNTKGVYFMQVQSSKYSKTIKLVFH